MLVYVFVTIIICATLSYVLASTMANSTTGSCYLLGRGHFSPTFILNNLNKNSFTKEQKTFYFRCFGGK